MEIFDVNKADKVTGFQLFLNDIRDKSGGLVMSLIIPEFYKDLMLNPKLEDPLDESQDFYLYAWYNQHSFPIYVDKSLTDTIYLIGNNKSNKFRVTNNGP